MIVVLRFWFALLFLVISATVVWASLDTPLWAIPGEVIRDAWFRATLVDLYVSFLTFFTWVAYKERMWVPRVGWFLAVVLLGSIGVTAYCLCQLFRVGPDATLADVLTRRN